MAGVQRSVGGDGRGVAGRHCRDGGDWFIDRGGKLADRIRSYTAPMAAPQRARLRSSKERVRDYALFVVLVGPNVALLLLFVYRPLADNIRLSFFDWNVSDPSARFVGLSNYTEWFTRSDTRQIVFNTAVFTGAAVVGSMVLGLALAMLLDRPLRGRNLVRSTVFAPFVISGAAVGLAAQFVFDPHFGLIQDLLRRIGVGVIQLAIPVLSWLQQLAEHVRTVGITPSVAATAVALPSSFPGDPADRLIYATAIEHGWRLVTKDRRLRSHRHPRPVTVW